MDVTSSKKWNKQRQTIGWNVRLEVERAPAVVQSEAKGRWMSRSYTQRMTSWDWMEYKDVLWNDPSLHCECVCCCHWLIIKLFWSMARQDKVRQYNQTEDWDEEGQS